MAGLNKEIWIDKLKDNFYAEQPVLDGVEDWTEWVENNTINFASVGADPVVLKNNATWPIVAAQRTDTALAVALDTYDSTTTRVRNLEQIEVAYDKLESVIQQHKKSMLVGPTGIVPEAIWNYAPASNAAATPVIQTTGTTRTIGSLSTAGNRLLLADVSSLQERFDLLDYPEDGRLLALSPVHRKDLMDQDTNLFKEFMNLKEGQALRLFGFDVMPYSKTPTYAKGTYAKKAFGAAIDNVNDVPSSVAYVKGEMMKCIGDAEMFWREKSNNPEQRSDEVGFQIRAKAVPQRLQAIGAIVTARA